MYKGIVLLLFLLLASCTEVKRDGNNASEKKIENTPEVKPYNAEDKIEEVVYDYDTTLWAEITEKDGVILDLRYATTDNFTEKQIYPCGRCFLRPSLAQHIKDLQHDISIKYGWRLKLFDCYRPQPAQQKLWDIVPDPRYVMRPSKGSMHNRGLAVDLTVTDKHGNDWDMGTPFDSFLPQSHTDYKKLPKDVLKNRKILTTLMKIHGLKGIRTEWWHFSDRYATGEISSWQWECPPK